MTKKRGLLGLKALVVIILAIMILVPNCIFISEILGGVTKDDPEAGGSFPLVVGEEMYLFYHRGAEKQQIYWGKLSKLFSDSVKITEGEEQQNLYPSAVLLNEKTYLFYVKGTEKEDRSMTSCSGYSEKEACLRNDQSYGFGPCVWDNLMVFIDGPGGSGCVECPDTCSLTVGEREAAGTKGYYISNYEIEGEKLFDLDPCGCASGGKERRDWQEVNYEVFYKIWMGETEGWSEERQITDESEVELGVAKSVVFEDDIYLFYSQEHALGGSKIVYRKGSEDFGAVHQLTPPSGNHLDPSGVVHEGKLYVFYTAKEGGKWDLRYKVLESGTWSSEIKITEVPLGYLGAGSPIGFSWRGNLGVVYHLADAEGGMKIFYRTKKEDFGEEYVMAGQTDVLIGYPGVAIYKDKLYLFYSKKVAGNWEVHYKSFKDGTWSGERRVYLG